MLNVQKKIANASSDSILFAHRAALLLEDKQVEQAVRLCEEGLKRFPFYGEGHHVLARCYQALNRPEEARAEYERTLFYMPNHIQAQKGLAYLHFKNKMHKTGNDILLTNALYDPLNMELMKYLKSEGLADLLWSGGAGADPQTPEAEARPLEESAPAAEEISLPQEEAPVVDDSLFEETPAEKEEVIKAEDILPISEEEAQIPAEEPQPPAPKEPAILDEDELIEMPIASADMPEAEVERTSLLEDIEEGEVAEAEPMGKIDLNQFDNTQDDFSTLMNGIFETTAGGENEEVMEVPQPEEMPALEEEPEETAEERPILDTSVIFNENRQPDENDQAAAGEPEAESAKVPPIEEALDLHDKELQQIENDILAAEPAPPEETSPEEAGTSEGAAAPAETAEETGSLPSFDEENVDIEEILENPRMLTPTFGEILIAQKKFEDARKVFRELYQRDPQNFRLKKKIDFLDKIIAFQK